MSETRVQRERRVWIAAVSVLAACVAWLAVVDVLLLAHVHAGTLGESMVVAKVLGRVLFIVGRQMLPMFPAALVVVGTLGLLLSARAPRAARSEGRR